MQDIPRSILPPEAASFAGSVPVLIVGGGGCGLSAALAAKEGGAEVLILERDNSALGTTAMSTGLIPAPGSIFQKAKGIEDSPELFAADIMKKTRGQTDPAIALALAQEGAPTVEWLVNAHGVPLDLVDSFRYPGHSRMRMHGTPTRSGAELMGALHSAAERLSIDIITQACVSEVFADTTGHVHGVRLTRPDGSVEDIGCEALILACCGFAGSQDLVAKHIPEIADATFFGHPGNKGDAIRWGEDLGAEIADIHAYQGHAGLAYGYGVPILWAHIVHGGYQVNADGLRFANEMLGYSEHAREVVAQPGHFAWSIYDQRIHELMAEFDDYSDAMKAGCIRSAATIDELCAVTGLPDSFKKTADDVAAMARGERPDPLGRDFTSGQPLQPPYKAVKVCGALFHTQGGLVVDRQARVLRADKSGLPNLFAGGGAARGISGPSCWGYLAGNGLLTATAYGRLAGRSAAAQVVHAPNAG